MKNTSPDAIATFKEEEAEWTAELERLQMLAPLEVALNRIKNKELPILEQQIKTQETAIPSDLGKSREVRYSWESRAQTDNLPQALEKLDHLKKELKDISSLLQHSAHVSRTQKEIRRLEEEIADIENDLSATGSAKTADEIQLELDGVVTEM
jgi:DNA repair protein RAD50